MKRYLITYLDCGEIHYFTCKAYDRAHAEEKFIDPDMGFTLEMIQSTKRI